jgi:flavin reductase (DIM6/NTAB) family NADH-FMN oxidoreductase RutF
MKKQLKTKDIFFPVPAALVVCGEPEHPNIITIAWIGMVSSSPPAIQLSIHKDRYSLELIRRCKEFTVNIPPSSLYRETDYCGITSGRNTNKFNDTGLTPMNSIAIKIPIIKECPFNMECKVIREIEIGDYTMFIGEILEVHVDEDKMSSENRAQVDIDKVDPLVYCATIREYRKLGGKLGDAFKCGQSFKNQKTL